MSSTLWIKFKNNQTLKTVLINDFNYFLNKFFISDYGFQINDSQNHEIFFDDRSLWVTSKSSDNNIDYVSFLAKKFNTPILSFADGNFYFFNIMGDKIDINSIKEFQNLFCIIFDYLNKDEKNENCLHQNLSLRYKDIFSDFKNQLLTYISVLNKFFDGENSTRNSINSLSNDLFNLSNGLFLKKNCKAVNNSAAFKKDSINFKTSNIQTQKRKNLEKAQLLDSKIIDDVFLKSNNDISNNDNNEPYFLNENLSLDSCKKQFDQNRNIKENNSNGNFDFFSPNDNNNKFNSINNNNFLNLEKSNNKELDLLKEIHENKKQNIYTKENDDNLSSINKDFFSDDNNLNSLIEKKLFLLNKYKENDEENIDLIIIQKISMESYKLHESLMKDSWSDSYKYNFCSFFKEQSNNLNINSRTTEKTSNLISNDNSVISDIKLEKDFITEIKEKDDHNNLIDNINNLLNDNKFDEEIVDKYQFDEILCPCSDDNNISDNQLNLQKKDLLLNSIDPVFTQSIDSSLKENIEKDINDFYSKNLINNINDEKIFNKPENKDDFLVKESNKNVIEIDSYLLNPINNDDIDELINRELIDKNPDELVLEFEKEENNLFNLNREGNNMNANNKYESLNFTSDEIYKNTNNNFGELNLNNNSNIKNEKYVSFDFTDNLEIKNKPEQNSSFFDTNLNSKKISIKPISFNFDNVPEVYDEKINININFKNLANDFIKKENQNFIDFMELNKKDEEERLNLSLEIEKFLNELKEEKRKIQLKRQELQNKLHR